MEEIVKVENVTKQYKNETVLNNVSVNFYPNKIYGIVGKNGAGKTVLFKCILGFVHPTEGSVHVLGKQIGKDVDFAESTGMIIEAPGFIKNYSAFENLKYLARIRNQISDSDIKNAIEMVGLDPNSKKKVGKFSLGMRQRLGIAQALMENPKLIILDEPMNGLDRDGIKIVKELLLKLREEGKTIIMASHYEEDMSICDEIYEMDRGCLSI